MKFEGLRISFEDGINKENSYMGNPLQIKKKSEPDAYIDLEEPGKLVNHSCSPNSVV